MKINQLARNLWVLILSVLMSIGLSATDKSTVVVLQKKIDLDLFMKNPQVKDFTETMSVKTGVLFSYDSAISGRRMGNVEIQVKKSSLEYILDCVFSHIDDLDYKIVNNSVLICDSPKSQEPVSQQSIHGTVLDDAGNPMIGAGVFIKGSKNGTITDIDGKYQINAKEGDVLIFSFIGFHDEEVIVEKSNIVDVVLKPDTNVLEDVVVVGYGTQKKVNLTAAVETVDTKMLENRPVRSVVEMLEGVVPNLNVTTTSGAPDATPSLNIRGFTGMNSKSSPLVLVDGVEQNNLDLVNPADIENISVLKDAAASAIYGSRAPHGVILVTTKSGNFGEKPTITYSGTYQLNQPSMLPHNSSSVDWATSLNDCFRNELAPAFYKDSVIQKMQDFIDGKIDTWNDVVGGVWGKQRDAYANTDYVGYAFKKVSQNTSHDLSISGGTKKSKYYAGLGYNFREGIYNTKIDKFNRYSAIMKLNTKITDWLSLGLNSRYTRRSTIRPSYRNRPGGTNSDNYFWEQLSYFPNIPIFNPDGEYHVLSAMPVLSGKYGDARTKMDDFWLTTDMDIEPLKGWHIKGMFSWNVQSLGRDRYSIRHYIIDADGKKYLGARCQANDFLEKSVNRNQYYTFDLITTYHHNWGKNDFTSLLGMQMEEKRFNGMSASCTGLYSPSLPSLNTSWQDNLVTSESRYHWSTMGYFFRLSYNYASRYLLDINARYDAASKYPASSRWAFFPSVSAGWNVAKEPFWPLKQVSTLKFTASYGKLGDQAGGNYLYIPTMGTSPMNNTALGGERPPFVSKPGIVSPNLTWAKPTTLGFGAELSAFDSRLNVEYYWYQRTVRDQLGPAEKYPEVLGTNPPASNNAVSETRGWEISLSWRDQLARLAGSPLNYSVRFVLSDYIGYVVKYTDNKSGSRASWTPGQLFGEIRGYESAGIAQTKEDLLNGPLPGLTFYYTGDLMFKDLNGDGIINNGVNGTWYSMGDLKTLGFNYPRFKYGITLGLDWKNFYVNLFLDGVGKQVKYMNNYVSFGHTHHYGGSTLYRHNAELGYWSANNKDAFYPRAYAYSGKNFVNANDQYMINLSHLRIRNLSFGYNLPDKSVKKIGLKSLSFNGSIENLGFIFRKSWLPMDPQMINGAGYPIQRTYSFGVKVGI